MGIWKIPQELDHLDRRLREGEHPRLFSEVVNLHPVAIIVSVLFFGGLWGIWGVFFAIPLATLVQAVIVAWPTTSENTG